MKKKNLMATLSFISAACMVFGTTMIQNNVSADEAGKRYANLFNYDEETLTVTEGYSPSDKGLDIGRSGVLFTSKKSGNDAEGTSFSYDGIMSGAFGMDFRVFSEKSYEENNPEKTYTHTACNWDLMGNLGAINNLFTAEEFNPYLDLREVGITFTSTLDSSKWFTVYVRGGNPNLGADMVTVRVFTSEDAQDWPYAMKGYGYIGGEWTWPTASWMGASEYGYGAMNADIVSTFSNTLANGALANASTNISFNPETMQVSANGKMVRVLNADYIHTYNEWFGTLDAAYFTNGYTVDVEFTDVTSNDLAGTALVDAADGYQNVEDAGFKPFDETYDRYANMVVYSFGKTALSDEGPSATLTTTAASVGDLTLDSAKFENSANAVHLTTNKTGDDAEGTKFNVNQTFNDSFEIDFRVFSQKNYAELDPTLNRTHTAIGWGGNNLGNTIANFYMQDTYNPYLDLKEVGITFTSVSNPSQWFTVFVRGAYADGRADLSSARVSTSYDKLYSTGEWPYPLDGYGIVGGDGWPHATWQAGEGNCYALGASYTMLNSSFSNTNVAGESKASMIKFDPTTMQVYGWNESWNLVRDMKNNTGLHTFADWFTGTFDPADFTSGYTVSIEFTDMTSNSTTGDKLVDSDAGYNACNMGYAPFTEAYTRYANMYVYSIKSGDTTLDNTDLITPAERPAKQPAVKADYNKKVTDGLTLDVTPEVYDVNFGKMAYTGTVTWMNLDDETTGTIEATDGKYLFKPATNGTYIISYSSMSGDGYLATDSFAVAVLAADHDYAWVDEVPATCLTNGTKGHYFCAVCEKSFDEDYAEMTDLTITAGDAYHNYGEWIDEVAATCVDNGTKGHYFCSVCETNFDAEYAVIENLTITAGAEYHAYGEWNAEVPATCTETGIKGYYYCRYCEEYLDADKNVIEDIVIPMEAHAYGEWVTEVPATCTEDGVKGHKYCSKCEKHYDADGVEITDLAIEATGHADADEDGICDGCDLDLDPTDNQPTGDETVSSLFGCFGSIQQSSFVIVFVMATACLFIMKRREENN